MNKEQDQIFVQNFIIILVMLLGMIAIFVIIARTLGTREVTIAKQRAERIAEETRPIGSVRLAGRTTGVTASSQTDVIDAEAGPVDIGQKIYNGLCFSCHGTGLPNIPQVGSVAEWIDRIAQGTGLLYDHAIRGFTGASGMPMPPKGGNATLTDDEVKSAVDYMIATSQ